jgi:hypothetical protein
MLSKRIAGILKQYPNPEVAFFATEVLTGNATSVYLQSGFSRQRRSRGIPSNYLTPSNPPEDRYLRFSVDDPIEKIKQTEWRLKPDLDDWRHAAYPAGLPPLQGRELLRDDLITLGFGTLGDALQTYLKSGKWYTDLPLDQTLNTEVMSMWVAVWVNRWLKAFSKLTTIGQLVDHYAAIRKLTSGLSDMCDYVSEERIDPAHLTLNQLLHRSHRWHAAQRRDEMAAAAPPAERVYDRDKYGVFKLTTREALEHEGNFMNHCVGRYWKDVHDGVKDIYSVRNLDGQSVATVEVQEGRVVQIKGPSNRAVTKPLELCDTVYYFLESIGAANRTGSCMEPSQARENPEDEATKGKAMRRRRNPRQLIVAENNRFATINLSAEQSRGFFPVALSFTGDASVKSKGFRTAARGESPSVLDGTLAGPDAIEVSIPVSIYTEKGVDDPAMLVFTIETIEEDVVGLTWRIIADESILLEDDE